MMKITCKKCGKKLEAPDEAEGKKGKCPDCGMIFVVSRECAPRPEKLEKKDVLPPRAGKPLLPVKDVAFWFFRRRVLTGHLFYWSSAWVLLVGMVEYLEYGIVWGMILSLLLSGSIFMLLRHFLELGLCIPALRHAIDTGRSKDEIMRISDAAFDKDPPGDGEGITVALAMSFLPFLSLITSGLRFVLPWDAGGRFFIALIITSLLTAGLYKILPDEKYNKKVFSLFKKTLRESAAPIYEAVSGEWESRREKEKKIADAQARVDSSKAAKEKHIREAPADKPAQPGCCSACLKPVKSGAYVVKFPMFKTLGYSDFIDTGWDQSWTEHYQKTEIEILLCSSCRDFLKSHPFKNWGVKDKIVTRLKKAEDVQEMLENGWKFPDQAGKDPASMTWDLNTKR